MPLALWGATLCVSLGALIIISSTLYITRREARLGRPVTKGVATPAAPPQAVAAAPDRVHDGG